MSQAKPEYSQHQRPSVTAEGHNYACSLWVVSWPHKASNDTGQRPIVNGNVSEEKANS